MILPEEFDGRQQLCTGSFASVATQQSNERFLQANRQQRQNVPHLIVQLCNL